MSKSCKNLANQTLFNLHLFDNVRYVFGDGDLGGDTCKLPWHNVT